MPKYHWKCSHPYCTGGSKKLNLRYRARRTGRGHLKRKHKDFISEPILIKEGEIK